MKAALIQMNSQADKAANLAQAKRLIEQAASEEHPDLIALPEMWTFLSEDDAGKRAAAEPVPGGEAYGLLQELAARHRIVLHGGSLIERNGDAVYNTTVVFGRDGRELARYRKLHLFDIVTPDGKEYRESATFTRGARVVSFDALDTRIGLSICYDLRFPELYLQLAKDGAKVILVPAAFTLQTGKDHWEALLRARAIETQTYVLAPAQWGRYAGGSRACYGHTLIVDPWGHVIAKAQDKVGYVVARLDLEEVERVRRRMPCAEHRVL
ncbi:MAG TPA: carbon-nitrogen hydrolase family protein [Geminicoccaceae bacterium]|nr:carbon-nitrogen hydrolase family protein [Geminicoccaceae bacterium]